MCQNSSESTRLQELKEQLSKKQATVASGPFEYDDYGLQVKVEQSYNIRRIGRCSSDHLIYLLTYVDPGPVLTKKGKPRIHQPPPHKDETAAFYQAQLVHYGLRPLKDKKRAKDLLLEAAEASDRNLTVPASIRELESLLAQEHGAQRQEARKIAREIEMIEFAARKNASRKRQLEEDKILADAYGQPCSNKRVKISPSRGSSEGSRQRVVSLSSLSGSYRIAAPDMRSFISLGDSQMVLEIGLSSTRSHLWGQFDVGAVKGTVRSEKLSSRSRKDTIKFQWRGRETGEGESTFDYKNVMTLRFRDEETFQGEIFWDCMGTIKIAGKRVRSDLSNGALSRKVFKWKGSYRQLNESNYEVERISRWGKWGGNPRPDKPSLSDTSEAETGDDGDEDEGYCYGRVY